MSVIKLIPFETHPISDTFIFYSDIDKVLHDYFKFKKYNDMSHDNRIDTEFHICVLNLEEVNISRILYDFTEFLTSMNEYIERKIEVELNWTDIDNYKERMSEIDEEIFTFCYDYFHVMSQNEIDEDENDKLFISDLEDIEDLKHYIESYNDKLKWLAYYRNKIKIEKLESASSNDYRDYILQAFNSYIFIDIDDDNIVMGISGNLYEYI